METWIHTITRLLMSDILKPGKMQDLLSKRFLFTISSLIKKTIFNLDMVNKNIKLKYVNQYILYT